MRGLAVFALTLAWLSAGLVDAPAQKAPDPKGLAPKVPDPKMAQKMPEKDTGPILTEIGGRTLEEWIKLIPSKDRSKGEVAIKSVVLFGPKRAAAAVPAILAELGKHRLGGIPIDQSIRANLAVALGKILGGMEKPDINHVKEAVRLLVPMLNDTQTILRFRAATALGEIGEEAASAIGPLTAGVKDTATWEVRDACVIALGSVAFDEKNGPSLTVLNALYYALTDPASQVRMNALRSISHLGAPKNNEELRRGLMKNLEPVATKDPEPAIQVWGQVAIMSIEEKVTSPRVQAIIRHLKNPDALVRVQAVQALGRIGSKSNEVTPALIFTLKDKDMSVVRWAILAMAGIYPSEPKLMVPALQAVVKDAAYPEDIRKLAEQAIEAIKRNAK